MKIIGEGGNALAIYPSIGCSKKTRINKYDYVTKLYKSTETAEEEYKIYSKLPEELNNKLYYNFCELCKIDSNINSYVDKIVEDYDIKKINYNSLLNIKYIHGVTLYDYLNHYKIIPIKKFIHLLELMVIFHEDIIKMNELHFYHRDIFSQNVMINFKVDKLFLIDFGRSKYSKKKENIDINNFNKMLEDVLDINNNKIKCVIRSVKKIYSKIDIHFLKLLQNEIKRKE